MDDRRLPHYLPGPSGTGGNNNGGNRVANLKLDLPVDEDDYLMPSPQSTTQPHHAAYMDLIGDAKLSGKIQINPTNQRLISLVSLVFFV